MPRGFFQVNGIIRIHNIVIKICAKCPKSDVPKPAKLDFLDVLCSDADILLDVGFQLIVSISAIHT